MIGGHLPVTTWKDLRKFQRFTADLWSRPQAAHEGRQERGRGRGAIRPVSKYPGYESTRVQGGVQAIYDELNGK